MASSLVELNALLDSFIPLSKKVSIAEIKVLEKEAEALDKILARVWMLMPCLYDCHIINRRELVPTGENSGFAVSNRLTLFDGGPHLFRSFVVEQWGTDSPAFEINDSKDISCKDAIQTYGFDAICAGLAEMLKCQCNVDVEYGNLQTRIKKIDSLIQVLGEKFKAECRMEA
ncbi:hypothetical protein [Methanosaeta sp. UBA356]|jgi:hypothetical protein|uniref:hypothetical protein n=1 Tax=Methanosaeta sp. UBA356 TaxID=1915559 RepID=UPI00257D5A3A|nr:hypothetical protein [Methanosaeta sp. UBA356]